MFEKFLENVLTIFLFFPFPLNFLKILFLKIQKHLVREKKKNHFVLCILIENFPALIKGALQKILH